MAINTLTPSEISRAQYFDSLASQALHDTFERPNINAQSNYEHFKLCMVLCAHGAALQSSYYGSHNAEKYTEVENEDLYASMGIAPVPHANFYAQDSDYSRHTHTTKNVIATHNPSLLINFINKIRPQALSYLSHENTLPKDVLQNCPYECQLNNKSSLTEYDNHTNNPSDSSFPSNEFVDQIFKSLKNTF